MWTRKELKTRAKTLFKMNYWKAVLAALLLSLLAGAGSGGFSGGSASLSSLSSGISSGIASSSASRSVYNSVNGGEIEVLPDNGDIYDAPVPSAPDSVSPLVGMMFAGMMTVIILIAAAIGIAVNILLVNPLVVGIRRFFSRNLYEKAQIRELAFAFDHHYVNVIKVMFFRDLHTFLWTLLFIIPGIIKSYEYRMMPYLLAEYPDMPKEDAFAISKYMMTGNKWKAFVLDLSFILWIIGSVCTLGLLGLFYADPYMAQTGAALYDALKAEKQPFAQQPAAQQTIAQQPAMDNPAPQDYNNGQ